MQKTAGTAEQKPARTLRKLPLLLDLPVTLLELIGRAGFYSVWYLVFFILCTFRPFTGMMILAAAVMLPISIIVYVHPSAAPEMPFWAFALMATGLVAVAVGYTLLLDWMTPPGVVDPFERFRPSDRGRSARGSAEP